VSSVSSVTCLSMGSLWCPWLAWFLGKLGLGLLLSQLSSRCARGCWISRRPCCPQPVMLSWGVLLSPALAASRGHPESCSRGRVWRARCLSFLGDTHPSARGRGHLHLFPGLTEVLAGSARAGSKVASPESTRAHA